MRVLIVADNAMTANGIKLEMRHSGFQIAGFISGRKPCGLIAAQQEPDVVLLDDMHTTDLTLARAEELRRAAPDAKILLLTLCMDESWLAQAFGGRRRRRALEDRAPGAAWARSCARSRSGNVVHALRRRPSRCAARDGLPADRPRARDPAPRRRGAHNAGSPASCG